MKEIIILVLSYFLVFTVILFDRRFGIGLWKDVFTASILSLLQLAGIGFVLIFLLKLNSHFINLSIIFVMLFNASLISLRRFRFRAYSKLKIFFLISFVLLTTASVLLSGYFLTGVIDLSPTKLIPMSGLVIASGMRALSFSISSFRTKLRDMEDIITGIVALGASDVQAFSFIFKELISDVTIPMRDMLRSSGIVHIPGIMVGLLMAGALPLKAAIVQFLILVSMLFEFTFAPSMFLFLMIKLFGLKIEKS